MLMKKLRSIKLLSKTTLFYLVFTLLAFFLSAIFLIREAEEFINDELEHRFSYTEKKIRRQIRTGKFPERIPSSAILSRLVHTPDLTTSITYSDTLMSTKNLSSLLSTNLITKKLISRKTSNPLKITLEAKLQLCNTLFHQALHLMLL